MCIAKTMESVGGQGKIMFNCHFYKSSTASITIVAEFLFMTHFTIHFQDKSTLQALAVPDDAMAQRHGSGGCDQVTCMALPISWG